MSENAQELRGFWSAWWLPLPAWKVDVYLNKWISGFNLGPIQVQYYSMRWLYYANLRRSEYVPAVYARVDRVGPWIGAAVIVGALVAATVAALIGGRA